MPFKLARARRLTEFWRLVFDLYSDRRYARKVACQLANSFGLNLGGFSGRSPGLSDDPEAAMVLRLTACNPESRTPIVPKSATEHLPLTS